MVKNLLNWAHLGDTLKVYLPECNMQKDAWKTELRDFSSKNDYHTSYRNNDYNWRCENDDTNEDINRASIAMGNLQLDRRARKFTLSWWVVFLTPLIIIFTLFGFMLKSTV